MRQLSRVVWSEGMHLAQHHFQAQSRYLEDAVAFAIEHLSGDAFGLCRVQFDPETLLNGTVTLLAAGGVMPDGLPFQIPESDPPPAPLAVAERASPVRDSHLILLTIPPYRPGGANATLDATTSPASARIGTTASTRFLAEIRRVRDETTGRDEQPIPLGRKNFRLALDGDGESEAAVTLALARIRRDGAGRWAFDADFVPPSLEIGASEALLTRLQRLLEVLNAKADALGATRRAMGTPLRDYAAHEVASFWLRHAVVSAVAPLQHYLQVRSAHPEALYLELSRLAGALTTFALDANLGGIPAYQHSDLTGCFAALDQRIRAHLEVVIPTNCVTIGLELKGPSLYTGAVADGRCFGSARWILGIRSPVGEANTITRTPQFVKVCSARWVPELVRRASPGLRLEHLPVPPPALSPRVDTQYFAIDLDRTSGCWRTLTDTREVGVYVPDALPDPELDLRILIET